jgi:hypothetical protein
MQKTICSVYFRPLTATRPFSKLRNRGGYRSLYELPAAEPGKFTTLVVEDGAQLTYIGEGKYQPIPVYADDNGDGTGSIAADLVNEWGQHVLGAEAGGPGVFVCAGDQPTSEELETARASQERWATYLVNLAEEEWRAGKRTNVQTIQREAAIWLGRQDLEWVKPPQQVITKPCPFCFKLMDSRAMTCPDGHIVDMGLYQQYLEQKQKIEASAAKPPVSGTIPGPIPPPLKNPQQKTA